MSSILRAIDPNLPTAQAQRSRRRRRVVVALLFYKNLHALLQRRTEVVQQFLVSVGNVAADRLFPVVPKPGEAGKGGARVVFSLN